MYLPDSEVDGIIGDIGLSVSNRADSERSCWKFSDFGEGFGTGLGKKFLVGGAPTEFTVGEDPPFFMGADTARERNWGERGEKKKK